MEWLAWSFAMMVAAGGCAMAETGFADRLPGAEENVTLRAPIDSWDEAIPLGNGLLGGLLWGSGNTIRLSLDRGDLWDERPAGEKDWWKIHTWAEGRRRIEAGDAKTAIDWWDSPYNGVSPTKLPAGRLEISLAPDQHVEQFELRLADAEGIAWLSGGVELRAFYSAASPVALVRIPCASPGLRLYAPIEVLRRSRGASAGPSSGGSVDGLGYPEARKGSEGRASWYVQDAADGLAYCVYIDSRVSRGETLLALTITSTNDGRDPVAIARQRCRAALTTGYEAAFRPHRDWWHAFWQQSVLHVPEPAIQQHVTLCRYFYGAASRRGAPPMPLQGVWTADTGGLPPWKGDYHNDLNTQMTYLGYLAAGNFDEGACYLDFLWKLVPRFRAFAHDFYGTPGLATPGVMSLAGQPLGGWGMYSLSPTMTSWNAHLFYLHWRYTGDDGFLRSRAYPWCKEAGECLRALLKPDEHGVLKLPLSSSPEIFDNTREAWVKPNSNYDLMCMRMQFLALSEMADTVGNHKEAAGWRQTASALGDYATDTDGALLVAPGTRLPASHRHLSNIIGLAPFNLITMDGSDTDRARVRDSLAYWDRLGTSGWCGYTYAWMSALRSRTGDAEVALRDLDVFVKAFVLRNGFHANGDQTHSGFSSMTYRPFTLEGNLAALWAIHEMLLQSWSPTPGVHDTEVIRIFPAVAWRWHDVSFEDLRAEGGYRVSARRQNNATVWLRVVAGKDGVVRIRDNFGGRMPRWSRGVSKVGLSYEAKLRKGEVLEAVLDQPASIPPAPTDAATAIGIR